MDFFSNHFLGSPHFAWPHFESLHFACPHFGTPHSACPHSAVRSPHSVFLPQPGKKLADHGSSKMVVCEGSSVHASYNKST